MNSVLTQVLDVLGASADVVYVLYRMSDSTDSFDFVMALDENLIREYLPNSAPPLVPVRWGRFVGTPYAAENILSTLSRARL